MVVTVAGAGLPGGLPESLRPRAAPLLQYFVWHGRRTSEYSMGGIVGGAASGARGFDGPAVPS